MTPVPPTWPSEATAVPQLDPAIVQGLTSRSARNRLPLDQCTGGEPAADDDGYCAGRCAVSVRRQGEDDEAHHGAAYNAHAQGGQDERRREEEEGRRAARGRPGSSPAPPSPRRRGWQRGRRVLLGVPARPQLDDDAASSIETLSANKLPRWYFCAVTHNSETTLFKALAEDSADLAS
jgi:hypothetical protein